MGYAFFAASIPTAAYIAGGVVLLFVVIGLRARAEVMQKKVLELPHGETGINRTKVHVKAKGFQFKPYLASEDDGISVAKAGLMDDEELLLIERDGARHAYIAREMAYHHIAQNTLAGEPYMVSF